jgi:hypothetical protein
MNLKRGPKYSLLVNSENLCRRPQKAIARLIAQAGEVLQATPLIANGCKKGKKSGNGVGKKKRHKAGSGGRTCGRSAGSSRAGDAARASPGALRQAGASPGGPPSSDSDQAKVHSFCTLKSVRGRSERNLPHSKEDEAAYSASLGIGRLGGTCR